MTVSLEAAVVPLDVGELLRDAGTRVVVLGASRDENAKVTLLLTPRGADRPTLAVKTATTSVAAKAVLAEASVLRELAQRDLAELQGTIPRVLDVVSSGGHPALVCEVLPGVPMSVDYHRWRHTSTPARVRADLDVVTGWLARWQELTGGPAAPVTWPAQLYVGLRARYAGHAQLPAALAVVCRAADLLADQETPRVAVHGDLWVGNVLRHGSGASATVSGVVDWEAGSAVGEPLRDLARLVLSYALYLDRHTRPGHRVDGHPGLRADRWGAGVTYALDGAGWFPTLAQEVLRAGLRRLGLDPRLWRAVAVAGLAEVAATADDPDFARHHLGLLLTQTQHVMEVPR